jgi:hypothetical protein
LFPPGAGLDAAGGGVGVPETGVEGVVVCADVASELPPPPHAASREERTTEQQAKRIHEPEKVLILCDPINDPNPYRADPSSGRGETCADVKSARSRPIWIAVRALPVREQNLLRSC